MSKQGRKLSTIVTIERGIGFFEDGSEVSGLSVGLVKAAPAMHKSLRRLLAHLEVVGVDVGLSETEKQDMAEARNTLFLLEG